jgi:hypothetical protein
MATLRRDEELIGLPDLALVQHAYSVVPRIYALDSCDDRGIADELYFVLDELVERFAPEIACEERRAAHASDPSAAASSLAYIEQRAALRKIAAALREQGVDDLDKQ